MSPSLVGASHLSSPCRPRAVLMALAATSAGAAVTKAVEPWPGLWGTGCLEGGTRRRVSRRAPASVLSLRARCASPAVAVACCS